MKTSEMTRVGEYVEEFNTITGQSLPCGPIYQDPGLIKHIQKRHPDGLANLERIPEVISSPDYIGRNPSEPDSIELVKRFDDNVMVCVKLDKHEKYLYVATVFDLKQIKLDKRINNGRLKKR